jgi:hypothetical protein
LRWAEFVRTETKSSRQDKEILWRQRARLVYPGGNVNPYSFTLSGMVRQIAIRKARAAEIIETLDDVEASVLQFIASFHEDEFLPPYSLTIR